MTWNYRGMIDSQGNHSVREVYYDEDGTIESFTVDPASPFGETEEDLVADIAMMLEGLNKPFMLETDFVADDQEVELAVIDGGKPDAIH